MQLPPPDRVVGILDTLVLATPLSPSGYTWTLPSRLGRILLEVEKLFGPRDRSYTLLGVEFSSNGPQTWFPRFSKDLIIQLSPGAMLDEDRALFQLAHEVVHVLDPVGFTHGSVLEEGLATYFQIEHMRKQGVRYASVLHATGCPKYTAACELASRLIAAAPDSVRTLRARGKRLSDFSADDLKGACPELSDSDAAVMTQRFRDWNP